jgi:hypothetical protein
MKHSTITSLGIGFLALSQGIAASADIRSTAARKMESVSVGYGGSQCSCRSIILPGHACGAGTACCADHTTGEIELPGEGDLFAQTSYLINDTTLVQAIWRGENGYMRNVPLEGGSPAWSKAQGWSPAIPLAPLPGTGAFQTHVTVVLPNKTLLQGYWRGNEGYSRTIPLDSTGRPIWDKATSWSEPVSIGTLPGSGDMQAQTAFTEANNTHLVQAFWRGDKGYSRTFAIYADGSVDWKSGAWSEVTDISSLPGAGSMQAQDDTMLPNGTLLQAFWRGGQGYVRTVPPTSAGTPDWLSASEWSAPITVAFPQ